MSRQCSFSLPPENVRKPMVEMEDCREMGWIETNNCDIYLDIFNVHFYVNLLRPS